MKMRNFLLYWLFTSLIGLSFNAIAQNPCNLVVNGDFETQNSPLLGGPHNVPTACFYPIEDVVGWKSTNTYDPSYYASNEVDAGHLPQSAPYGAFIPYNYSATAHNGCIGLITHSSGDANNAQNYVINKLNNSLDDSYYYGSMQVYTTSNQQQFAPIGLDITVNDVTDYSEPCTSANYRKFTPTGCGIQSNGIFSTTNQWTRISGVFKGIVGAKFINIGNFQPTVFIGPATSTAFAHVYVDNVEIYKIPTAGSDLSIPCGTVLTIGTTSSIGQGCGIPNATYAWSIGNSAPFANTIQTTVTPNNTTTYTLTVTLPDGNVFTSNVTISVTQPSPLAQPPIIKGNSSVCYERSTPNFTTFSIDAAAPSDAYYHSEFIYNATGQLQDTYDSNVGQPFKYEVVGGNYTAGQFTLRVRLQRTNACGTASNWTTKNVNIIHCSGSCGGRACPSVSSSLYPNPVSNELTIQSDGQSGQVIIYDSQGAIRKTIDFHEGNIQTVINTNDLPSGTYQLRVLSKTLPTRSSQIVIRH